MSTTVAEAKQRLIERVRDLAYLHSPDELFTLASGRQSPHFFDMKPVMMDPECAHLIGVLLHAEILDVELIRETLNVLLKFEDDIVTVAPQISGLLREAVHMR